MDISNVWISIIKIPIPANVTNLVHVLFSPWQKIIKNDNFQLDVNCNSALHKARLWKKNIEIAFFAINFYFRNVDMYVDMNQF